MALMHPITKAYLLMMREGIDQMLAEDSDTLGTNEYQMELTHKRTHENFITADIAMWDTHKGDGEDQRDLPFNVPGFCVPTEIAKIIPQHWDKVRKAFDKYGPAICPNCGGNTEPYAVENDLHTHWCEFCAVGLILKDDQWVSLEEAEKDNP